MSTQFERLALPSAVRKQILEHLEKGLKIDAIKCLTQALPHMDLKEAKDIIDEYSPGDRGTRLVERQTSPRGRATALQIGAILIASNALASIATQGMSGFGVALVLSVGFAFLVWIKGPQSGRKPTEWTAGLLFLYQVALPLFATFYFRDVFLLMRGPELSVPVFQTLTAADLGKVVRIAEPIELLPTQGATVLGEVKRNRRGKILAREYRVYPTLGGLGFVWSDVFRFHSGSNAKVETDLFEFESLERVPEEVAEASGLIQTMQGFSLPAGILRPIDEGQSLGWIAALWAVLTFGVFGAHLRMLVANTRKSV